MTLLPAERESRQEAKSHRQSLREAINQVQVSTGSNSSQAVLAEAKYDDSLCRKRKLEDLFIPCEDQNSLRKNLLLELLKGRINS